MITKILIANRGEIASRIIRTARRMGIETVAICSDADIGADFTKNADEIVYIGGVYATESYLVIDKIIDAAKKTGADAIHPGYGFLSENAEFAKNCAENDIIFIGPSSEAILEMGLKDRAKEIATIAGVRTIDGLNGDGSDEELAIAAEKIGYPVLIKAVAGGGGRGIRIVENAASFIPELDSARREAAAAFGNSAIMLEKYIAAARHIEVQIFGDNYGNIVHLFDRDCSVQRRRQKIIEEAPAPYLPDGVREALFENAIKIAKAVNYSGAGTIEFLVDVSKKTISETDLYFLEMNTRLQVEHTVTEEITGIDLVEWQIRVAKGRRLPLTQNQIKCNGHAIEVRVNAENIDECPPTNSTRILKPINHDGLRIDTSVNDGDFISDKYDSMIEKIIIHKTTRTEAISAMEVALWDYQILGVNHNLGYVTRILRLDDFGDDAFNLSTSIIQNNQTELSPSNAGDDVNLCLLAASLFAANYGKNDGFRVNSMHDYIATIFIDAKPKCIKVKNTGDSLFANHNDVVINVPKSVMDIFEYGSVKHIKSQEFQVFIFDNSYVLVTKFGTFYYSIPDFDAMITNDISENVIIANLPSKVIDVKVKQGENVTIGQVLVILEAMKMEHSLKATRDGIVDAIFISSGDQVKLGQKLLEIV